MAPRVQDGVGELADLGSLPGGLALDACRREVRAALGAPTKEGVPQPILCDAGEYFRDDTEPHVTGDADGLRATLVHVSRPGAVPWYPAALGD